ncbi:MAG: heavy metal translocating P-type ATPase [Chloroflexi bacterium]|nr:heavy metal translocating P-type ATPase [Chloroflexota bacterium]
MSQQRYRLGNLDCANCAREVQSALERLPDVQSAVVDFASSELEIEGEVAFDTLKARVEALGKTIEAPDVLKTYMIGNMDCAGCAHEVEAAVSKLNGVHFAEVDFLSNKLQLIGDVDYARLKDRVESLGKTISIDTLAQSQDVDSTRRAGVFGFWDFLLERPASRMAVYGGALLLLAIGLDLSAIAPPDISNLVYVLAMTVAIRPIAVSGINSLRISREFNINLLMTVAALGALALGEFLEAATVIFLFAIGEALEGFTTDRARDSLRGLVALKPPTANRIVGDRTEVVPVEALRISDRIRVLPGERIPMDGTVLAGNSAVDQAHITGESLPVERSPGDEVYAGSINGAATLDLRVDRLARDNTLSRIIELLQHTQSRRAPSQRLIDRFAHVYTPLVALGALGVAFIPPLLFGQPFWDSATGTGWLYRALSMLVIACPCALVISTPVTVISAITSAARRGVLIKGGAHLEALAGVKAIAFDKTGTLTRGKLDVVATATGDCDHAVSCQPCDELISLAASVEAQSTHPFAQAIQATAGAKGIEYGAAAEVESLTGFGVRGKVNGQPVTIGSHSFFDNEFDHTAQLCAIARDFESAGQSAVMVHDGDQVRGVIGLSDMPREESKRVVSELREMGLASVMLTGDNENVAESIAGLVGVDRFRARLLPQDKVKAVENLETEYQRVAMVGDGINDSPALAAATVGVAMGAAGSAQAMETADIVLMADRLDLLPRTIRRARFAQRLIRENIVLSIGLKLVFLLLALTGNVTMLAAVFADMGMSLAVTLNGMRALRE